jgi:DNA-binding SARP family transcriptional activator
MSCLQVKGFAGLELRANGCSIGSFPTHHVEELLGYLLLNQNKTVSRDLLIELLWPFEVSNNGRSCLNTVLWRLRCTLRQLGFKAGSFLVSTRDEIVFSPTVPIQFDVELFSERFEKAMSAQNDTTRIVELSKALELYQGDLYSGIFSDWCLIERERLARMYLQALGEMLYCNMRQKDYAKAIIVGQTILDNDPLREEVHRALILCYGRLGHRAEAWDQFQTCTQSLMSEVQVLPMADTVRIFQQVMNACANNCLDTPDTDLLKPAHQALAQFVQAGDRLHDLLDEIDSSRTLMLS